MEKQFVILSGSSNRKLGKKVAGRLNSKLGKIEIEEFANKEIRVRILEEVKDKTVFIIQSTIYPAERYIIELALIADAAKRAGAKKIIAIIPWFGYSPQDKVFRKGEPLSAEVIVKILEASSIDEFVLVDIHSMDVLKLFKKEVHHISAMETFINYFKQNLAKEEWCSVALDNGALERADLFAKRLNLPIAVFDKTRDRETGEVTFHSLKGDIRGKNVITFDDYVSTGGTTIQSCEFLKKKGAEKCYYCITHLIVPESIEKIKKSKIDKMFISDSIDWKIKPDVKNLKVISIGKLLADFIKSYID